MVKNWRHTYDSQMCAAKCQSSEDQIILQSCQLNQLQQPIHWKDWKPGSSPIKTNKNLSDNKNLQYTFMSRTICLWSYNMHNQLQVYTSNSAGHTLCLIADKWKHQFFFFVYEHSSNWPLICDTRKQQWKMLIIHSYWKSKSKEAMSFRQTI
jgi:hypothetical protein